MLQWFRRWFATRSQGANFRLRFCACSYDCVRSRLDCRADNGWQRVLQEHVVLRYGGGLKDAFGIFFGQYEATRWSTSELASTIELASYWPKKIPKASLRPPPYRRTKSKVKSEVSDCQVLEHLVGLRSVVTGSNNRQRKQQQTWILNSSSRLPLAHLLPLQAILH